MAEEKARLEAERLARLEAERQAAEAEKAKLAEEKARLEAERKAKELAAKEAAEAEKARLQAERLAKELAAKEAAEAERQRLAEEKARLEAEQLAAIDSLARVRQNEEKYRSLLLAADGSFRTSQWTPAREGYSQALEIKPGENYPTEQIRKIDEILLRMEQRAAKTPVIAENKETAPATPVSKPATNESDILYNDIIATADEAFTKKEYNVSRAWYYQALALKSNEPYPAGRIEEIRQILQSLLLTEFDREFQQNIDKGDEAFRNNELAVARSWYNRSLNIKPNDSYPKSQISEIQMKIAAQMEGNKDKVLKDYISQGDKAFADKNYNIARVWYQRAIQLKPGDSLSREKLDQVAKALSGTE